MCRDPLDGIAGHPDAAGIWNNLDLGGSTPSLPPCALPPCPAMHGQFLGGPYLDTSPTAIEFTWHQ